MIGSELSNSKNIGKLYATIKISDKTTNFC